MRSPSFLQCLSWAILYRPLNALLLDHLLDGLNLAAGFLDPYTELLGSILSGKGLLDGVLGGLAGALGQEATFDYVIVGGGTAGNAIGTRLAQGGSTVAIIEAGLYYELGKPVLSTTPLGDIVGTGSSILDSDPLVDWEFVTEPQAGANDRKMHYARGKCLGGTTALNFMIYQRGTKESFDQWATLVNDSSYTFDKILPYFEKSVTFTPPNIEARLANATTRYDTAVFSDTGGPVEVGFTNYITSFATFVNAAVSSLGFAQLDGFNSGKLLGASYCTSTLRSTDQTRSTSTTYIRQAQGLRNLKVFTQTHVNKVLFDSTKTATGVEVQSLGITYNMYASKEVIVSAGAFQSPQILMVSGIGPAHTLEDLGIEVISDLPGVGQNMWDHVVFGPSYEMSIKTQSEVLKNPIRLAEELVKYTTTSTGALCTPNGEFIAWEKLPMSHRQKFSGSTIEELAQFPDDWPEFISTAGFVGNWTFPLIDNLLAGTLEQQFSTILGALVAPTSRGNVTITSKSTLKLPIVNPNHLTTKTDQEVAIALYRRIREIYNTTPLQEVTVKEFFPGIEYSSDEQILDVIRNSLQTVWHASCTCAMGTRDNPMAVIDSDARVYGVQSLRVVDASSFPLLPPGHPVSAIYMLAEKIADSILTSQAGG